MKILYKNAQNTSKQLKNNEIHELIFATKQNWKILKYEIHHFTSSFLKKLAQLRRKEQSAFENRLKI